MIEFNKNIEAVLPYNREQYLDYLDDEYDSSTEWNAISFQLNKETELSDSIELIESIFKKIILEVDTNSFWILNHDDKDLKWFPNDEKNLISLRNLFQQNKIQNTFVGYLMLNKVDLLRIAKDLISYPFVLSYKNLDISHNKLKFIIKITSHLTIDLLSTDKLLLRKLVIKNSSEYFNIKEYRGTSLWT